MGVLKSMSGVETAAVSSSGARSDCCCRARLGGLDVDVAHEQIVLELRRTRAHRPGVIEHDARAVKDQFILTTDQVDIGDDRAVVLGAGAQHLFALAPLARVIR